MIRKKTPSKVSFLKYLGLLSFLMGIGLTYTSIIGNSLMANYLQYFPSWFTLDLSLLMGEEGLIFAAIFFSVAYLSSCLMCKFFPVDSYNGSGDLMIKKISGESREKKREINL